MRMNARVVALGAGVFFVSLAIFVQGLLPFLHPESRTTEVTQVVRTDLGELKWMRADATDYTELEQLGRQVYIREGCWYCHSQFVRPVTGETRRWGPVSQAGEYAFDVPHLFSTRRIGPDLTRVGLKYSDEWHLAHFWDPRMLVPDSIMPRFVGLFDVPGQRVAIVDDDAGNRTLERNDGHGGDLRLRQEGDGRRAPAADPQRRGPAVRAGARQVSGDLHAERRVHRGDGAARRHDRRSSRA